MRSSQVNAGDTGTIGQYNNLRDDAKASSWLLPHEQVSPNATLYVEGGSFYIYSALTAFAGGNSPSFTAPATNPRIDILSIDASGVLVITKGTESGSPVAPTVPTENMPICQVYNRVGQTTIRDVDTAGQGYIYKDVRPFFGIPSKTVKKEYIAICGTFTVTIASPAVFTCAGHGLVEGDIVRLTTTGALPTGLSINTTYYVISAGLTSSTFQLSLTLGGSAINTSGTQSGTHTVREVYIVSPYAKAVLVEGLGSGGSGSVYVAATGNVYQCGGGAGGEFRRAYIPFLSNTLGVSNPALSVIYITIGLGGAAITRSTAGGNNGNAGADTLFGSYMTIKGGSGGLAYSATAVAAGGTGGTTTEAVSLLAENGPNGANTDNPTAGASRFAGGGGKGSANGTQTAGGVGTVTGYSGSTGTQNASSADAGIGSGSGGVCCVPVSTVSVGKGGQGKIVTTTFF